MYVFFAFLCGIMYDVIIADNGGDLEINYRLWYAQVLPFTLYGRAMLVHTDDREASAYTTTIIISKLTAKMTETRARRMRSA